LAAAGDDHAPAASAQPWHERASGLPRSTQDECRLRQLAPDDISLISRYLMEPERPTSPLFVRIPRAEAERLDRASFELKRPKQELVAEAIRTLEVRRPPVGFARPSPGQSEVLTTAQLAELLQVDEEAVRALARRGGLPGRKIGRDWRFSRGAVLAWLANESG
jgi:excisionase family DNA binding protein